MPKKRAKGPAARLSPAAKKRMARQNEAKKEIIGKTYFHRMPVSITLESDGVSEEKVGEVIKNIEIFRDEITYKLVRSSNKTYYDALYKIYRFAKLIEKWPEDKKRVFLERVSGGKITKKQTIFHILLKYLIKYGESDGGGASRTALSRDARALLYAASQGWAAKRLRGKFREGYSGLDQMAREYAKSKRVYDDAVAPDQVEGDEPAYMGTAETMEETASQTAPGAGFGLAEGRKGVLPRDVGLHVLVGFIETPGVPIYIEESAKVADQPLQSRERLRRIVAEFVMKLREELRAEQQENDEDDDDFDLEDDDFDDERGEG